TPLISQLITISVGTGRTIQLQFIVQDTGTVFARIGHRLHVTHHQLHRIWSTVLFTIVNDQLNHVNAVFFDGDLGHYRGRIGQRGNAVRGTEDSPLVSEAIAIRITAAGTVQRQGVTDIGLLIRASIGYRWSVDWRSLRVRVFRAWVFRIWIFRIWIFWVWIAGARIFRVRVTGTRILRIRVARTWVLRVRITRTGVFWIRITWAWIFWIWITRTWVLRTWILRFRIFRIRVAGILRINTRIVTNQTIGIQIVNKVRVVGMIGQIQSAMGLSHSDIAVHHIFTRTHNWQAGVSLFIDYPDAVLAVHLTFCAVSLTE